MDRDGPFQGTLWLRLYHFCFYASEDAKEKYMRMGEIVIAVVVPGFTQRAFYPAKLWTEGERGWARF
jgi:hypothetical protein